MPLFHEADRRLVEIVSRLAYCNPFLQERIALERQALGADFDESRADWNIHSDDAENHPNLLRLKERTESALRGARDKLAQGTKPSSRDAELYEDLLLFAVYHELLPDIDVLLGTTPKRGGGITAKTLYRRLVEWVTPYAQVAPNRSPLEKQWPHVFAGCVQLRRAFHNIYQFIVGTSRVTTQLRAAVWESVFTHDMRRYRRWLFRHLVDYATLITGPTGTGKELVARAVGLSRYIPFDKTTGQFVEDSAGAFFPIHLAALSPTLIESELFGHQRGAFTGAVAARVGWLESCPASGSVFLDEIGELEPALQVKLLRVLQTREFSRLGESKLRRFPGKIIAATNRDLASEIQQGRFREDVFYRLCSDVIIVPSLAERLKDDPQELHDLVTHIVERIAGPEAAELASEMERDIESQLGRGYPWPGNVRELEQCLRNLLIRRRYAPLAAAPAANLTGNSAEATSLARELLSGELTAEQVLCRYCRVVYAQTGSYEATARRLGLDRRTVRAKLMVE